jgi:uncharacterized protein (TIGR02186 family)
MRATTLLIAAALVALLVGGAALANTTCPPMDMSLSQSRVEMGMTYDGEKIAVSGTAPAGSQVAVLLVSKENPPLKLSRKGRVGLFWMSVKQLEACNLPYLYRLYTSAPLASLAPSATTKGLDLGYGTLEGELVTKCLSGEPTTDDADVLFKGFLQLKEDAGLYGVRETSLTVGPTGAFEQAVELPDRAQPGGYYVHVYAFKDGRLVASATRELSAEKVGLDAWLYKTARENGLFYGVMAVVVALGAGLGTGMIFKKGGAH